MIGLPGYLKRATVRWRGGTLDRPQTAFYPLSETCQIPRLDDLYTQYFGERVDGCFVEIGAYDGEYASNTSGLADIGWRGVYVEPVESSYLACKQRHRSNDAITVRRLVIGESRGDAQIEAAGPLSTTDAPTRARLSTLPWAKHLFAETHVETVEQITLNDLLETSDVKPGFELLVVDVEGAEWSVLRPFDVGRWRPTMVIVELHDQNPDYADLRERENLIVEYFARHRYKVVYKDFTNTVYVSEERTLA